MLQRVCISMRYNDMGSLFAGYITRSSPPSSRLTRQLVLETILAATSRCEPRPLYGSRSTRACGVRRRGVRAHFGDVLVVCSGGNVFQ